MRTPTLFLTLLIPFMVLLITSCRSIRDPDFRAIENFKLKRLGVKESGFDLELVYNNPNKSGLQLKKAEGEVWLEDNFLGHFQMDTLIRIQPNADFRLPVRLQVDMSQVLKNSMIALLNKEVRLKIEGTARIGKAGLFIRYPIKYEGMHNLGELLR